MYHGVCQCCHWVGLLWKIFACWLNRTVQKVQLSGSQFTKQKSKDSASSILFHPVLNGSICLCGFGHILHTHIIENAEGSISFVLDVMNVSNPLQRSKRPWFGTDMPSQLQASTPLLANIDIRHMHWYVTLVKWNIMIPEDYPDKGKN